MDRYNFQPRRIERTQNRSHGRCRLIRSGTQDLVVDDEVANSLRLARAPPALAERPALLQTRSAPSPPSTRPSTPSAHLQRQRGLDRRWRSAPPGGPLLRDSGSSKESSTPTQPDLKSASTTPLVPPDPAPSSAHPGTTPSAHGSIPAQCPACAACRPNIPAPAALPRLLVENDRAVRRRVWRDPRRGGRATGLATSDSRGLSIPGPLPTFAPHIQLPFAPHPAEPRRRCPETRAWPESGRASVVRIFIVVDLPAPFGPKSPKIVPASTENVRPFSAFTPGAPLA